MPTSPIKSGTIRKRLIRLCSVVLFLWYLILWSSEKWYKFKLQNERDINMGVIVIIIALLEKAFSIGQDLADVRSLLNPEHKKIYDNIIANESMCGSHRSKSECEALTRLFKRIPPNEPTEGEILPQNQSETRTEERSEQGANNYGDSTSRIHIVGDRLISQVRIDEENVLQTEIPLELLKKSIPYRGG
jgi:hypothetical protein